MPSLCGCWLCAYEEKFPRILPVGVYKRVSGRRTNEKELQRRRWRRIRKFASQLGGDESANATWERVEGEKLLLQSMLARRRMEEVQ